MSRWVQRLWQSRRTGYVLAALTIAAVGIAAFLAARYGFSRDNPAVAQAPQPGPSTTPEVREQPPNPTVQPRLDAVSADAAKPKFVGQLNGFTFVADSADIPNRPDCTRAQLRELPRPEVAAAINASSLNFDASSIPSDYKLTNETATVCGSTVIGVGRAYSSDKAVFPISITREKGDAWYTAFAPRDRTETTTINGRPAVLVKPVYQGALAFVLMHDKQGTTWTISAGMSVDEVVKIAEGLQ